MVFSEYLRDYAQQEYDSRMQWMADRQRAVSEKKTADCPGRDSWMGEENITGRPGRDSWMGQENITDCKGRNNWMELFQEEIRHKLAGCTPEEQILMKFFYGTMPLRDMAEYDFETFSDFVRHGIWLRETMEWCRNLPEEIFLNDVLYYRINSENIEKCRPFFYEKLKDRIQGKSLEEAVLEINYWCAEHCAYEASDLRTISPMGMYRAGAGRCGEESVFAVTAFRSVGIGARQVYAPWWSHCDDNHAWVEVYVDGTWQFLGACEPEETLNQGWFVNASSRALLIHARRFSDFGRKFSAAGCSQAKQETETAGRVVQTYFGNEEVSGEMEWYREGELPCYQNVTAGYAKTRRLQITVTEPDGSPAKDASVFAEVLNGAEYRPIAVLKTDWEGKAALSMGLGTIHLWAVKEGRITEKLLDVSECSQVHLRIDACRMEEASQEIIQSGKFFQRAEGEFAQWSDIDFHAPGETLLKPEILKRQRTKNRERIQKAAMLRTARTEKFYQEELEEEYQEEKEILRHAAGNFPQLYQFLKRDESPDRKWLLHSLSPKDYRDARADVMEEHLQYASVYRSMWVGEEDEIYRKYILCPRIFWEEMTCYRKEISAYFSEEEKELFRRNPKAIWDYIKTHIEYEEQLEYRTLYSTPASVLKLQAGTPMSQKILCAAICRTLGIPARISQAEQEVEIYRNGSFVKLSGTEREICRDGDKAESFGLAVLVLRRKEEEEWNYSQNWTISRFRSGQFVTLDYQGLEFEGTALNLELEPGYYRILTANRLPNGNQLAAECKIFLQAGGKQELSLKMRTGLPEELLVSHFFKDFEALDHGKRTPISALTKDGVTVLAFLEPGEEPTEHVLNELSSYQEGFRRMGVRVCFLVREENVTKTAAWKQAVSALPEVCVYQVSLEEIVEPLARSMYTDPEKLPLLVIVNPGLQGIYACSGYRAGSVKLMLELLKANQSHLPHTNLPEA